MVLKSLLDTILILYVHVHLPFTVRVKNGYLWENFCSSMFVDSQSNIANQQANNTEEKIYEKLWKAQKFFQLESLAVYGMYIHSYAIFKQGIFDIPYGTKLLHGI